MSPCPPVRFPDPPAGFRWQSLGNDASLEVLASERFPVPHGFTCRVRNRRPEAPALGVRGAMDADLDLLEASSGLCALHSLWQVHGDRVRVAGDAGRSPDPPSGDALIAVTPGAGVAIKAADCVPVLVADPLSGAVAGAHAGWRGTLVRVVEKAARALAAEAGAPVSRLAAVIGPSIRACCFEVGSEVVSAFAETGHDVERFTVRPGAAGRPHLDLPLANRRQLLHAGLRDDAIQDVALCTRCHPVFHSHRREGPGVGRNWSLVAAGAGG